MSFTKVCYNGELFNSILKKLVCNDQEIEYFKSLITHNFISISGSSILQILQEKLYSNSDLDIYIEINSIDESKWKIINELITFLGKIYKYSRKNIMQFNNQIYNYYNYKTNYQSQNTNQSNNINNSHYSGLKKYIRFYQLFQYKNKKIELIFINTTIETLLLNTFDYDIVKNYWKMNLVYSFNLFSIQNKIATMTLKHFINRILLGSNKEFTNFINRYSKYSSRGYKIFIHKTYISNNIFNHMLKMKMNNKFASNFSNFASNIEISNDRHARSMNEHNYYYINFYLNNQEIIIGDRSQYDISYYNNNLNYFIYSFSSYIIKYILINSVTQNYLVRKKLNNYSNKLVKFYMNPQSKSLYYKIQHWDDEQENSTKITYINSNNELQILKLKC